MVSVKSIKNIVGHSVGIFVNWDYVYHSVRYTVWDSIQDSTTLSVHDSINLNQYQVRDSINEEY